MFISTASRHRRGVSRAVAAVLVLALAFAAVWTQVAPASAHELAGDHVHVNPSHINSSGTEACEADRTEPDDEWHWIITFPGPPDDRPTPKPAAIFVKFASEDDYIQVLLDPESPAEVAHYFHFSHLADTMEDAYFVIPDDPSWDGWSGNFNLSHYPCGQGTEDPQSSLEVTKSADTSYTRTCDWDIEKTVDEDEHTVLEGETVDVTYTVTVDPDCENSEFAVSGTITVLNNGDVAVVVTGVSDLVSFGDDDVPADSVVCDLEALEAEDFPVTLGPGESFDCEYSLSLLEPEDGSNTATATALIEEEEVPFDSEPVAFSFEDADVNEVDTCVDIYDSNIVDDDNNQVVLFTACEDDELTWTKEYDLDLGPFDKCTTNTEDNTAVVVGEDGDELDESTVTVTVTVNCDVTFCKWYDADRDGIWDEDEVAIEGWLITIDGDDYYTGEDGCVTVSVAPGSGVTGTEGTPNEENWAHTTEPSVTILEVLEDTQVDFGNVCWETPGGRTIGFWGNKNGQALIDDDDLEALRDLHLRNADGSNFDPNTKGDVKNFLRGAKATNMANMLSAQLIATVLGVRNGFTDPDVVVYNGMTVAELIEYADGLLFADGVTKAGDPNRAEQAAVKDVLDAINNGQSFDQPEPCVFTFGE